METIQIVKIEDSNWFEVFQGDRRSDRLTYEEMLGLVSALTIPDKWPGVSWMKTNEQHANDNKPRQLPLVPRRQQL